MTQLELDDESVQIMIQGPMTEQKRANKQLVKDAQLKFNVNHNRLDLYLTINQIYFRNLITKKQKPNLIPAQKLKAGKDCILYKEFMISASQGKLFLGDDVVIRGYLVLNFLNQINVEFKIYMDKEVKRAEDFSWMNFHYSSMGMWKSKNHSLILSDDNRTFTCRIPFDDINGYLEPNLLVNASFRRKETSDSNYLGIINLGNTCFMNSCLQMLFYIRPLRKIIVDSKAKHKVVKTLRDVFLRLIDVQQKNPVDAEPLLEAFEKYNELPRRQQDVQEFLLDFIDELEAECPQVKALWGGKCSETTVSQEKDKPYRSVQREDFSQLDVHMIDRKGHYYHRIQHCLMDSLLEEEVDELIENQEHGRIRVSKHRTYEILPDVLFINLKRYEFNKEKLRLSKILNQIDYGETLNMGFLIGTPGNTDPNPQSDYRLFSVLVHKGTSPQNGHYFVFVNTAEDDEHPNWMCFNDSVVRSSDSDEVLKFTGKKDKETILDKGLAKFVEKEFESDQSAYMLVYIRKGVYREYQSISVPLPKDFIITKNRQEAQKQQQNLQEVNILGVSDIESLRNIFSNTEDQIPLQLRKDQSLKEQIKRVAKPLLNGEAKYIYKVYGSSKVLKLVHKHDTVEFINRFKRGHQIVTCFLVLSSKIEGLNAIDWNKPYGMIRVLKNELKEDIFQPEVHFFTYNQFLQYKHKIEEKNATIHPLTDIQDFQEGWNLYMEVQVLKNR